MTTPVEIKSDIQKLTVADGSPYAELFQIDLNPIGVATTYNFTAGPISGASIVWNSIEFTPISIEAEGFELTSDGKFPRPIIRLSNINRLLVGALVTYRDFVNCKITRIRTHQKYLDGEAEADTAQIYRQDIYYVNRKTIQNKYMIEWELISPIESINKRIPGKQVLPTCTHRYRILNVAAEVQNTDLVTCPYVDSNYFEQDGSVTGNANEDKCGKKLSDCRLRFGDTTVLPFQGFPNCRRFSVSYKGR